jgi:hypothetical protein
MLVAVFAKAYEFSVNADGPDEYAAAKVSAEEESARFNVFNVLGKSVNVSVVPDC